ncbi:MAG: periplasmic heavy metal sensor [bacterium]
MKTNNRNLKITLLLVFLGLTSTAIIAQTSDNSPKVSKTTGLQSQNDFDQPPPPPPPPPVPPVPGCDQPDMPPLFPDIPGLTEAQIDQMKRSGLKNMEAMTPLRNQVQEKTARIRTILTTMPFNQKEADQAADEIGRLNASMLKQSIRHDQELRAILTPDQQILFDSRPKPFLNREKIERHPR